MHSLRWTEMNAPDIKQMIMVVFDGAGLDL